MNDFKDEEFRAEIFKLLGFACGAPFGNFILKLVFDGLEAFEIYELVMSMSLFFLGYIFVSKSYEIMLRSTENYRNLPKWRNKK